MDVTPSPRKRYSVGIYLTARLTTALMPVSTMVVVSREFCGQRKQLNHCGCLVTNVHSMHVSQHAKPQISVPLPHVKTCG